MASPRATVSGGWPLTPATVSASISLTTRRSSAPSTSGGTAAAGAMLRIVRARRSLARTRAAKVSCGPDLVLAQDGGPCPQHALGHLVGPGLQVGAAGDDDRVLATLVDPDHRDRRGRLRHRQELAADTGLLQQPAHHGPIGVGTHMPDEGDLGPRLGGRRGLVRPLAARRHDVARAQHGLARPRQLRDLEQQVGIDRPRHDDHDASPAWPAALLAPRGRGRPCPAAESAVNGRGRAQSGAQSEMPSH